MAHPQSPRIKIFVADDHEVVCLGLRALFDKTPDINLEDQASDGHELLKKINSRKCNLLLYEIGIPGPDGLDILKKIRAEKPELPVLIFSCLPEEQHGLRYIRAGAAGYLPKTFPANQLIEAIRTVSQGRKYISPSLAEKLANNLETDSEKPLHHSLSDREFQVFCMIASGKTVSEIARELSLSVPTISTYRTRILEKMKLKNNSQLTHYAATNGLIG